MAAMEQAAAVKEVIKEQTIDVAVREGVRAAIAAATVSGAAVFAANKYSPWFRTSLGISGKVGTVMMCVAGSFFLTAELALVDAQRNPDAYGFDKVAAAEAAAAKAAAAEKELHIRPKHLYVRTANYLYDHPFHMISALSVPIIGGIFYQELQKPGLKLSQRIIHTRVQGQMSVVAILAITMGFRDWMQRNGGHLQEIDD